MPFLQKIRQKVLAVSLLLAVGIYMYVATTISQGTLQIIRLTQIYALVSVLYIYLALLATPLTRTFTRLPFRGQYITARRAIGVSAWFFALLHVLLAFFGQLGGFEGLFFLSDKYLLAISISFVAFIILTLMAATSFDKVIAKLTYPKWKMLHRFVYLASVLIITHALLLGTHFADLSGAIPQISFVLLTFLLLLEAKRFDTYLSQKFVNIPQLGISSVIAISLVLLGILYYFLPVPTDGGGISFGIHAQHILLAKQAQNGNATTSSTQNIPGLIGDRTKRYTVSFFHPDNPQPNTDIPLSFTVFDASSGNPVIYYTQVYEKILHLIIVNDSLDYFTHIHPTLTGRNFTITTSFPKAGRYHLYLDFQPLGAIEQQMAFTLDVGTNATISQPQQKPDTNLTKTVDNYTVTLAFEKPLIASKLSIGEQPFTFTITDAKTKKPITTLKPYLAAFGHLVMINQKTYDYIHVHPTNRVAPKPTDNGGPQVEFLPLGLYGPIKPGTYRVFAQFNPDNKLIISDFTIAIE
jgi:DMSO/TMAO reductase YedYZ heme-binding membrane subunit